jgi:hypothetical protein
MDQPAETPAVAAAEVSFPGEPEQLRAYLGTHNAACPICRYNLRGVSGAVCPECGSTLRLALADVVQGPGYRRALLFAFLWPLAVNGTLFVGMVLSLVRGGFFRRGESLIMAMGPALWWLAYWIAPMAACATFLAAAVSLVIIWRSRRKPLASRTVRVLFGVCAWLLLVDVVSRYIWIYTWF